MASRIPGMLLAALLALFPSMQTKAQPAAAQAAAEVRVVDAVAECFTLRRSQPRQAIEIADRAIARANPSTPERIKLLSCKGMAMALSGDSKGAMGTVEEIESRLKDAPQPPGFVLRAYSNAGATAHLAGNIPRAIDLYLRAFEAARGEDADEAQVSTLVNIGSLYSEELGAFDEAERYFAQADALKASARSSDALLPYNRAMNHLRAGALAKADHAFGIAEQLALKSDMTIVVLRARAERLALRARHERVAGLQARLAAIAAEQQATQDPAGASTTLVRASALSLLKGDAPQALASAQQAQQLADSGGFLSEQRDAMQARSDALVALARFEEALALSQRLAQRHIAQLQQHNLRGIADLQARLQDGYAAGELGRVRDAQRIKELRDANVRQGRLWLAVGLVVLALTGLGIAVYQRVLNQRLQRLSTTDALTGLLNRRAAAARIQQLSADQQANADRRHVMLLIDIDHFKQLNDRAGHAAGDRVLVEVARRLRACCRPDDVVARWGGEEFLIACAPMSLTQASAFAERIRAGIASLDAQDTPLKITMTASVGFSCWPFLPGADPTRSGDWQDALSLADRAMYAAKHAGRNAWVGLWGKANARCSLEEALDVPQHGVAAGDIDVAASLRIAAWQPAPARAA